jgi:anionic cell wall polymer biosynthesis LytR-Cps2A-Psr (LCP) family protein
MAAQRRRRRTTVLTVLSAALIVLAVGVVLVPFLTQQGGRTSAATTPDAAAPAGEGGQDAAAAPAGPGRDTNSLLLMSYDDPEGPAVSATLLAAEPDADNGAVIFVPVGLLVDVPGIGLDRLGLAHRYDGPNLLRRSLENALGVQIDGVASLSRGGLAELLSRAGPLEVDVGGEPLVPAGSDPDAAPSFDPGRQQLGGEEAASYWTLTAQGEDPLAQFPRQEQVVTALLERLNEEPGLIDRVVTGDAGNFDTTTDVDFVRTTLTDLAEALDAGELAFETLPVQPFGGTGSDGSATFRLGEDTEAALSLLDGASEDPSDG